MAVAVKEDAADPKAGTVDCEVPNAGVCADPKPEAEVVVVNPNGDGAAEGAGAERKKNAHSYSYGVEAHENVVSNRFKIKKCHKSA